MNRVLVHAAARMFAIVRRTDIAGMAEDLIAAAALILFFGGALFILAGLGLSDAGLDLVEVAP